MNSRTKTLLLALALIAVICASAFWILRKSGPPADYEPRLQVQNMIGEVLADETIKALGGSGKVVVVTLDEGISPELDAHAEAFEERLKKSSVRIIRTDSISAEKASKYGPGNGMSGRRFVKLAEKYSDADAIISFVGVPDPDDDEMKELKEKRLPKFLAFSRSSEHLKELTQKGWLHAAVVSRFEFPAPGPEKPRTPDQWFEKHFQVVRTAASVSPPK